MKVWSCGVNDDAALGRITQDVPDPNNPGSFMDIDELTAVPHPLQTLIDENFRAVRVAAGDSISAAISSEGELRVWGSFRVSIHEQIVGGTSISIMVSRPTKVHLALPTVGNINSHQFQYSNSATNPATSRKSSPLRPVTITCSF